MKTQLKLFSSCIILSAMVQAQVFKSETNKVGVSKSIETQKETSRVEAKVILPPKNQVPVNLIQLGEGQYFSKTALVLDKKNRTLSLWEAQSSGLPIHIKSFASDHGRKKGNKNVVGDLKTPEGIYFFQEMYQGKQLNYGEYGKRAFTMDYPNYFDRKSRKTGSGIWLHAIPETKTLFRGSRGCVVVKNPDIDFLKSHISLKKTPIVINENVEYLPKARFLTLQLDLRNWLSKWKQSWTQKDIETYMSFYNENFRSLKMSKSQWRNYKTSLNDKYNYISVEIAEPIILIHGKNATIHFAQSYQSDLLKDFGTKTLHLKKVDGDFKILNETWKPATQNLSTSNDQSLVGDSTTSTNNTAENKF